LVADIRGACDPGRHGDAWKKEQEEQRLTASAHGAVYQGELRWVRMLRWAIRRIVCRVSAHSAGGRQEKADGDGSGSRVMEQVGEATSGGIRPRLLSAMQSRIPRTAVAMEEPASRSPSEAIGLLSPWRQSGVRRCDGPSWGRVSRCRPDYRYRSGAPVESSVKRRRSVSPGALRERRRRVRARRRRLALVTSRCTDVARPLICVINVSDRAS
jgi:hypothetical protein